MCVWIVWLLPQCISSSQDRHFFPPFCWYYRSVTTYVFRYKYFSTTVNFKHFWWWSTPAYLHPLFSSVAQSCPILCDPMNRSMPGFPVRHWLPEFTQTHVHRVSDAIQPSYPLSSPSPPAPNPSQHQRLFQWVNSSHEVAKVLEFQL